MAPGVVTPAPTVDLNHERLTTEAFFAALCGTAPVPASSGKTTRHRLPGAGTAARTTLCTPSPWSGWAATLGPVSSSSTSATEAGPTPKSCGYSNEPSPANSSSSCPDPAQRWRSTTCDLPARPEHHPARRRSRPRQPRHDHQPHGTRALPQHRPNHPVPRVAQDCLTPIGAATPPRRRTPSGRRSQRAPGLATGLRPSSTGGRSGGPAALVGGRARAPRLK
jgi:hypothetical protein